MKPWNERITPSGKRFGDPIGTGRYYAGQGAPRNEPPPRKKLHLVEKVPFVCADRGGALMNPMNYVTGQLGSGKSYYAVRKIFDYLAQGKYVATNFDISGDWYSTAVSMSIPRKYVLVTKDERWERLKWMVAHLWRFEDLLDLDGWILPGDPDQENRGLLVVDEGGLRMNTRNMHDSRKKSEAETGDKNAELEFFVNLRKKGWTMLLLAQDMEMVDKQIRAVGVMEIECRNFARMMLPLVKASVFKHPRFVHIHRQHQRGGVHLMGREWAKLDVNIARHYRSHQEFSMRDYRSVGMRPMVNWAEKFSFGGGMTYERWRELVEPTLGERRWA